MNEKIQISDLTIDNYTAKDAMQHVLEYMNTESLNVVQMITFETLERLADDEELQKQVSEFDITFAGDKAILEAAGIQDARRLHDAEPLLFVKLVLRFLHKNQMRVFLLAQDEEDLQGMYEYLAEEYAGIQIVGRANIEEHGISDDMILNMVNSVEADSILSVLPSPIQERFVIRNKQLLHAKIWIGLGNWFHKMKQEHSVFGKIKKSIAKWILKKEMKKKEENA